MINGLGVNMSFLSQMRYRVLLGGLVFVVGATLIWQRPSSNDNVNPHFGYDSATEDTLSNPVTGVPVHNDAALTQLLHTVSTMSDYSLDYPLPPSGFGKMGKRLRVLQDRIEASESLPDRTMEEETSILRDRIDRTTLSLFPFLRSPSQSFNSSLSHLRQRFEPGSKGIVIPTGQKTFRYACHLVENLRGALGSKILIEIVYAGDSDLTSQHRDFITSLGSDIEVMDNTRIFDDATLDLEHGGWAIKTFAALGSKYEQVVVLDADAIFLQAIFDHHSGYKTTGTLLFHDRLLWQGAFKERHEWWEKQLEHHTPSKALSKSRVYNENYVEECDSGLVALDKSRLPVLLGLLYACWQNTKEVRDNWTYTMGYGDKESWWFGLELVGAEYSFEDHYGSMIGDLKEDQSKVCSFTIAHVDDRDKLLWYNGSLLKKN